MKRYFLLLLFMSSCFYQSHDVAFMHTVSPRKQKQRIASLRKKLEIAEKEQKEIQNEVEQLTGELHRAELALIRKQVDQYENKKHKSPSLFLSEREILYRMIQSGETPSTLEAQAELDRILRIITEVSDENKSG